MSGTGFELGLGEAATSGVYLVDRGDLDSVGAAARDAGLGLIRVDLGGCRDKRTLLWRFAVALSTPTGRGGNWDALADDLRDLGWLGATGHALLVEDAGGLHDARPTDVATLLGILEDVAESWSTRGVPFYAFVDLPGPGPGQAGDLSPA